MSHKINDDCVSCGACVDACPCAAITEVDGKFIIDPEKCTDCGACADTCPNAAIAPEE